MAPPPRRRRAGAPALIALKGPVRFRSTIARQSAGDIVASVCRLPPPATLTMKSTTAQFGFGARHGTFECVVVAHVQGAGDGSRAGAAQFLRQLLGAGPR